MKRFLCSHVEQISSDVVVQLDIGQLNIAVSQSDSQIPHEFKVVSVAVGAHNRTINHLWGRIFPIVVGFFAFGALSMDHFPADGILAILTVS